MSANHLIIWNAQGMNSRACRNVVRDIVQQQRASIVCLQESNVTEYTVTMNSDIIGSDFDYACLPASEWAEALCPLSVVTSRVFLRLVYVVSRSP
jgi:hypothetical protein